MRAFNVISAGAGVTIQDAGRPGYLAYGLSRGGAADTLALHEGAALLQQSADLAVVEMAVMGGEFEALCDMRIALTGAPMPASIDGREILWQASHAVSKGARLSIGAVKAGNYGYLHVGGGVKSAKTLGAQGVHLAAGIGSSLQAGQCLELGHEKWNGERGNRILSVAERWNGGQLRVLPSLQTHWFDQKTITRFEDSVFTRDTRGNRMGVRLVPNGEGFQSEAGLSVLSEVIVQGDIQITGDGSPFVLLCECGTTGGYPRIGSVLPVDLPKIAQAPAGCEIRFKFVSLEEAIDAQKLDADERSVLAAQCRPLHRDPATIDGLLTYQLISGVIDGQ